MIVEGDYDTNLRYGYKKTKYILNYKINLQKIDDLKYDWNSMNIILKEITNYTDKH